MSGIARLMLIGAIAASAFAFASAFAQTTGSFDPADSQPSGLPNAGSGVLDPGKPDTGDQHPPSDDDKNKTPAPPPSLPGSHTQPQAVAPASRSTADMDPTAALFDAIDRGDTIAARDSVNRGANLDGKNVLGLTPIELSVDLNRNDISFLLLSMRGSAAPGAPVPVKTGSARLSRGGKQNTFGKTAVGAVPASDPSVGFLGFDHVGAGG